MNNNINFSKKIILTIAVIIFFSANLLAQKESILLYGTVNVNSNKTSSDSKTTVFGIAPGIGYQFSNHITLGVNLAYNYSQSTPANSSSLPSVNTFGVGPFVRYSCPVSGIFSFFTQLNTNYDHTSQSGAPNINGFDAKIYPAFCANIKNGIALIFSFGSMSYVNSKVSGATNSASTFGLNFGSGATFGISKHFGGKK